MVMILKIDNLGMNGEGVARLKNIETEKTINNKEFDKTYNDANQSLIKEDNRFDALRNNLNSLSKDVASQKVVFVPFALKDEIVEAEIINEKSKFCTAQVIKVVEPSKDRIDVPCPYFAKCGGCNLQHLNYIKQLEFKTNLVKETLLKVGGIDTDVLPCVASSNYGYRNKGVFPLGKNIGMFEIGSHNIVEIDKCLLMNDKINLVLRLVKEWINEYNIKTFDFDTYKGLLKYLVVRSVNDQTLICLVSTSENILHLDALVEKLNKLGTFGLYVNINNQKNSIILGKQFKHIAGIKNISLDEFGIKYDVDVASFLQVNNDIKTKLYSDVASYVGGGMVIDAYAGAGLLSAILSKRAKEVVSVEIVPEASEKARILVQQNNITNMQVINGDCTKILPDLIKRVLSKMSKSANENSENINLNQKCTVVLDPAHIGCSEKVIESVKTADKIIYIACNPIALAKDLKVLQQTHKIIKIQPYDMFPQTKHVETLVVLQRT